MAENKIAVTYDTCPACGCMETIAGKAWEESGKTLPKELIPCLFTVAHPLIAQTSLIQPPMVEGIIAEWDACLECGTLRVIRKQQAMIQNPFFGNRN